MSWYKKSQNRQGQGIVQGYLTQIKEMKESMLMKKPEGFYCVGPEDFLLQNGLEL